MRLLLPALALILGVAVTLGVTMLGQNRMTDDKRADLREEVRAYLMENPEVLMEAIGVLQDRESTAQAEADAQMLADQRDALVNDGFSYVDGNPDGDITIVEFMDYNCGYYKQAFPEVERLLEEDGNIRLIVKEFPILREGSVTAARFALAAKLVGGDGAYKLIHDTLMGVRGEIDLDMLTRLGNTLGLDTEEITARMDTEEVTQMIAANHALGQALSISGTPTFVIESEMIRGYVPADAMADLIADLRG